MRKYLLFVLLLSVIASGTALTQAPALAESVDTGKAVTVHYKVIVDDQVVDSTEGRDPFMYIQGQSTGILPIIQQKLQGLTPGQSLSIKLEPENAFGAVNPNAIVEINKSNLPDGDYQVGTTLSQTWVQTGIIQDIKDNAVVVNFNHPLAGKNVQYDINVIDVGNPPPPAEQAGPVQQ